MRNKRHNKAPKIDKAFAAQQISIEFEIIVANMDDPDLVCESLLNLEKLDLNYDEKRRSYKFLKQALDIHGADSVFCRFEKLLAEFENKDEGNSPEAPNSPSHE